MTGCRSNILQSGISYNQRQRLVFLPQCHLCPKGSKRRMRISLPCMKYSGTVRIGVSLLRTDSSRPPTPTPQAWDDQPATVLEPCTALAGPAHKEGSTCSHLWDMEASPQIPSTYKWANVLICNWHKWHAGDLTKDKRSKNAGLACSGVNATASQQDLQLLTLPYLILGSPFFFFFPLGSGGGEMRWKMHVVSKSKGIQDSQSSDYVHQKKEWKQRWIILTLTHFRYIQLCPQVSWH